ncbi:MAG: tRNA (N6-isopentenyl adenosine(37)-C2)-methylthiotransferase MiaB, partial [Candidatus Aminicenantes bacterium]|nr:tRNA (N6-isopentenyl adenosine(37)-C2)-methylthiotransferase MiaB [Candidatus Aminicenantes bacterium]
MKHFFIRTYGCQMNDLDSEIMAGQLARMGINEAQSEENADVIILNTCSVRATAERKVFGRLDLLAGLKKDNPDVIIAVCGCMAEEH